MKNSYGGEFGEEGYFRIARDQSQLVNFITLNIQSQGSPPPSRAQGQVAPSGRLLCAPEAVTVGVGDTSLEDTLLMSAVQFAVEEINNESLINCTGSSNPATIKMPVLN